ncbi:hypothetical protein [Ruixingdingia sedimenti]|uniref:Uncharacterized protein n=1 Tax=Ruixingdingia sedimenti TaxID=3073604 RepID=A0ABU1FEB0_9RHOB|nr:hypothetical protein [Xinfangfangia sp. LG-4]MDR5655227.1 hypothetical protein [Xinfangfangia sp. LG-4]
MTVGIFPDRDMASRFSAFLRDEEVELPDCRPPAFAAAAADVAEAEAEAEALAESEEHLPSDAPPRLPFEGPGRCMPDREDDRPMPPAFIKAPTLPAEATAAAFARIQTGERIGEVAPDFGLTMAQLRAMWANHRRQMQKHIAESGRQPCVLCAKPFVPSVDHPDTCARCRHA